MLTDVPTPGILAAGDRFPVGRVHSLLHFSVVMFSRLCDVRSPDCVQRPRRGPFVWI